MREVKLALLEADVNFKVVKKFVNSVTERAVGEEVLSSLTPGQTVIKIVNEEMTALMGPGTTELKLRPQNEITVIMMVGLTGAGKTTTAVKLGARLKGRGAKPLLAGCDIYRPAAIKQLEVNAEKAGVPVFSAGRDISPENIAKAAFEHAKKNGFNVLILDTAGRLHIDDEMMDELLRIRESVDVDWSILTVDAMTGQDGANVAKTFDDRVGIDGVILTKLDGDARGGAALSVKAVTGKPILFTGTGEKLSDLEQFYPDRMASRILGMGDVLTLIEKAEAAIDEDKAKDLDRKMRRSEFNFDDYLEYMDQIKNMGGLSEMLSMVPGISGKISDDQMPDDRQIKKVESIIFSMTKQERQNPSILNVSRKARIAKGAGVDISEVNRLVKQFKEAGKMMKSMQAVSSGKRARRRGFNLPF